MNHRVFTTGPHLLPVLGCRYPALPQHAVPCQILHIVSCCKVDLAVSKPTASLCLQSLACCSTDRHTACTQVKDHESCCTSLGEDQEAWMVPGPACVLQDDPRLGCAGQLSVAYTLQLTFMGLLQLGMWPQTEC